MRQRNGHARGQGKCPAKIARVAIVVLEPPASAAFYYSLGNKGTGRHIILY